jgi:SpoVK/Ycf46/Vps4 family AAA+-type ATPase
MEIDSVQGTLPVFAATNLPSHLDRAVTRRFQIQLQFTLPDLIQRELFVRSELRFLPRPFVVPALVHLTEGFSYAHLSNLVRRIKYSEGEPTIAWKQLMRALVQSAPPELSGKIQKFESTPVERQARDMVLWGIERQVIASIYGVSPALITRWLAEEE